MIPLGKNAADSLPSSSATSDSSLATGPRSAYWSHWSMPRVSQASASERSISAGVRGRCQETVSVQARATARKRSWKSSVMIPTLAAVLPPATARSAPRQIRCSAANGQSKGPLALSPTLLR